MSDIKLSIAIPTFNRAPNLDLLLAALLPQAAAYATRVQVLVCDNASTDDTKAVLERWRARYPALEVHASAVNVGMDGNFDRCYRAACGEYFWMIGDDDLVRPNLVEKVLALLDAEAPDVLHINSEWHADLSQTQHADPLAQLRAIVLDREEFTRALNVWITYISGNVTRITELKRSDLHALPRYDGSKLLQLSWMTPAIQRGTKFLMTLDAGVLATAENSGGYRLFEVFGKNLERILAAEWGSDSKAYRTVLGLASLTYIPALLWKTRSGRNRNFRQEDILDNLKVYKPFLSYWLLISPIARFPLPAAVPFAIAARLVKAGMRIVAKASMLLRTSVSAKSRLRRY